MKTSAATRPGFELDFLAVALYALLAIIGPSINSRPSFYFLNNVIKPRFLNGTGSYSEGASI